MHFNPRALLIFVAFGVLVAVAVSAPRSGWFHVAEAITTVLIVVGVAGYARLRTK